MTENLKNVPTVAELFANGDSPEILFWVGCAQKRVAQAIRQEERETSFCFRCWLRTILP